MSWEQELAEVYQNGPFCTHQHKLTSELPHKLVLAYYSGQALLIAAHVSNAIEDGSFPNRDHRHSVVLPRSLDEQVSSNISADANHGKTNEPWMW